MDIFRRRSLTFFLSALIRGLTQRLMLLFWRGSILEETTKSRQIEDVGLHQSLGDTSNVCDQSVEKIETHGLTYDHAQNFSLFFVRGE